MGWDWGHGLFGRLSSYDHEELVALIRVQELKHTLSHDFGYLKVILLKRDPRHCTVVRYVGPSCHRPELDRTTVNVFPDLLADDRIAFLRVTAFGKSTGALSTTRL